MPTKKIKEASRILPTIIPTFDETERECWQPLLSPDTGGKVSEG
jgi:hypothetical protein